MANGNNSNHGNGKSLESWIWDAACSIRGAKDAAKYKEFILPLIFTKRLCDVFDDELDRIAKEVGSRAKAFNLVRRDKKLVRFYLPLTPKNPDDDVWSVIRTRNDAERKRDDPYLAKLGEGLTTYMRAIADANPLLKGIIDRVDFNATTHGVRDLDDDRLSNLIEAISAKRLGLADVEADIIGRSYEYLIRKFAEGGGQSAGRVLHPRRGRPRHGPDHGRRAGDGDLRPLLRLGGPPDQMRVDAPREDEPPFPQDLCPVPPLRPGIGARHLGDGEHERDHP
jgi:type I restriction enzyme M protein